jgi:ribosomal protein L11 methyltransferase
MSAAARACWPSRRPRPARRSPSAPTSTQPSVRIANENAKLNQAGARFVHAFGLNDRKVRGQGPYDLVFANILAPPLVSLSQDIKEALKLGGVAILSGLLRTQERRVTAAYLSRGFVLERRIHRDAWSALVLRRVG